LFSGSGTAGSSPPCQGRRALSRQWPSGSIFKKYRWFYLRAHLATSEHLSHHHLGRPNPPPPSRAPHPPAASGCARGVPCRSIHSIYTRNRTFYPHIRPPRPSFRASTRRRFALQCNERLGVRTQRMSMDIDPHTPHVSLSCIYLETARANKQTNKSDCGGGTPRPLAVPPPSGRVKRRGGLCT
jgi:hypothetical protein